MDPDWRPSRYAGMDQCGIISWLHRSRLSNVEELTCPACGLRSDIRLSVGKQNVAQLKASHWHLTNSRLMTEDLRRPNRPGIIGLPSRRSTRRQPHTPDFRPVVIRPRAYIRISIRLKRFYSFTRSFLRIIRGVCICTCSDLRQAGSRGIGRAKRLIAIAVEMTNRDATCPNRVH